MEIEIVKALLYKFEFSENSVKKFLGSFLND